MCIRDSSQTHQGELCENENEDKKCPEGQETSSGSELSFIADMSDLLTIDNLAELGSLQKKKRKAGQRKVKEVRTTCSD